MASNPPDPGYIWMMKGIDMKLTETAKGKAMNYYSIIQSPVGDLMLAADASALTGLYFVGCDHIPGASKRWTRDARHPVLREAAKQLREYFAGRRKSFSLPLRLAGTDFQRRVWREISRQTLRWKSVPASRSGSEKLFLLPAKYSRSCFAASRRTGCRASRVQRLLAPGM